MSVDIQGFASRGVTQVKDMSRDMEAKIADLTSKGESMKQEDLIMFQYEMGQYNAFMTFLNHTISSMTSLTKEMAQSIK